MFLPYSGDTVSVLRRVVPDQRLDDGLGRVLDVEVPGTPGPHAFSVRRIDEKSHVRRTVRN